MLLLNLHVTKNIAQRLNTLPMTCNMSSLWRFFLTTRMIPSFAGYIPLVFIRYQLVCTTSTANTVFSLIVQLWDLHFNLRDKGGIIREVGILEREGSFLNVLKSSLKIPFPQKTVPRNDRGKSE